MFIYSHDNYLIIYLIHNCIINVCVDNDGYYFCFRNFVKPISGRSHVYLMFLPFYHIYALGVIMGFALHKGSSQVVMETFDFDLFLKYIVKYKVRKLQNTKN